MNALTLTHDLHKLFGNFDIAFEPAGSLPHTYKINYVETTAWVGWKGSQ
jgi:hypothetical protein